MIDLIVVAARGSNIRNAKVSVVSDFASASVVVSAGNVGNASLPTALGVTSAKLIADIRISIESDNEKITAFASNIPNDATIVIFGSNSRRFDGQIYHSHEKIFPAAPTCTLKCTPNSQPMNGPGCRECNEGGLVFKICC